MSAVLDQQHAGLLVAAWAGATGTRAGNIQEPEIDAIPLPVGAIARLGARQRERCQCAPYRQCVPHPRVTTGVVEIIMTQHQRIEARGPGRQNTRHHHRAAHLKAARKRRSGIEQQPVASGIHQNGITLPHVQGGHPKLSRGHVTRHRQQHRAHRQHQQQRLRMRHPQQPQQCRQLSDQHPGRRRGRLQYGNRPEDTQHCQHGTEQKIGDQQAGRRSRGPDQRQQPAGEGERHHADADHRHGNQVGQCADPGETIGEQDQQRCHGQGQRPLGLDQRGTRHPSRCPGRCDQRYRAGGRCRGGLPCARPRPRPRPATMIAPEQQDQQQHRTKGQPETLLVNRQRVEQQHPDQRHRQRRASLAPPTRGDQQQ